MGNLRGSSFQKQIKNAMYRLDARGTKRYGTDSKLTHSNALYQKREMYLKDFAKFAEKKELDGKLNTLMTPENVTEFLNNRLSELSPKSALDYVTGFNSLLNGLEQTKVNIPQEAHQVLREYTSDYRTEFNQVKNGFETERSISDTEAFLNNLQEIRESSAVVAQLQLETGLRVSEALEVTRNFQDYYNSQAGELAGIVGKGGQLYAEKEITQELAYKLNNLEQVPSYSTYRNDINILEHKTHDLRITFSKNYYQQLTKEGYSHKEALKLTSIELNHRRESITLYYLARV